MSTKTKPTDERPPLPEQPTAAPSEKAEPVVLEKYVEECPDCGAEAWGKR